MKKIRLGNKNPNPFKKRKLRLAIKKYWPFLLVTVFLVGLAVFLTSLSGSTTLVNFNLFANPLKSADNRVNVLFLGIAGGTHDGANLTDTIMVASYNLKTNQAYLISIPRDLWLNKLKSKANAVYELGLSQKNGLDFAKTTIGNILGIPIHYALRVDFRGFVQSVDAVGGIDVEVARSFDDYLYPIEGQEDNLCGMQEKEIDVSADEAKQLNIQPGKQTVLITQDGKIATDSAQEDQGAKYFSCRYEHISFTAGKTHMDGQTALKFVRSRHGTNNEGSDFARSARQERVLQALRSKILSLQTLSDVNKISKLTAALGKSIDTDISAKDAFEFYQLSKRLQVTHSFTIDNSIKKEGLLLKGEDSLLIHPAIQDYGGAYVLIPQNDDFSVIQDYVKKVLLGEITEYDATASARPGS